MEPGTHVKEIVQSFPPSGASYSQALEQLKSRYARDDLLIEIYVRELLGLVLSQARQNSQLTMTKLYDQLTAQIRALESLGVTKNKYSAFIFPLVESSLPGEILKVWERSRVSCITTDRLLSESNLARHSEKEEFVSSTDRELDNLLAFLKREVESEQRVELVKSTFSDSKENEIPIQQPAAAECLIAGVKRTDLKVCVFCDKDTHVSLECYKVPKMTLEQRKELLKKKGACILCLKVGHNVKFCKSYTKCCICSRRHSMVLCPGKQEEDSSIISNDTVTNLSQVRGVTLLQTILIVIANGNKRMTIRALFDNGSQRSYIKKSVADALSLKSVRKEMLSHRLFGGVETKTSGHDVYDINVQSVDNTFNYNLSVLAQPLICGNIPRYDCKDRNMLNFLVQNNITLTDEGENAPEIGMLIGADFSGFLMTNEFVHFDKGLVAIKTKLGWTLQGKQITNKSNVNVTSLFCCSNVDLADFWNLENLGIKDPAEAKSKMQSEEDTMMAFEKGIKVENGRYEVNLPWTYGHDELLNNYDVAFRRLNATTKRLVSAGKFDVYGNVFREWLSLGIIEVVPENEQNIDTGMHYLPHRAVVKESSLTTKVRPVFDASAKDKNGRSLNSCLDKGLNFLDKIPALLVGFRKGSIGVTADIAKAFLQISLTPRDRNYLRFLWWKDDTKREVVTYRHCRVVFGLTSSPFLLSATIMHHLGGVIRSTSDKSDSANRLSKTFYVDNCVTSLDSVEDTLKFISESKEIMQEGKFDLRQWVTSPLQINEAEQSVISVLGLSWDTVEDVLYCNLNALPDLSAQGSNQITKRHILSLTQRIFDPIGYTCPVTLVPKLLLQETWRLKLNWDEPLPINISTEFTKWYKNIYYLKDCKIPRRLTKDVMQKCKVSLHMFCDASKNAYAACVFLRSEKEGDVNVQLVAAKSRVAPPKQISIPRLELTAALIGARLVADTKANLNIPNCEEYYWTDSTVALYWIGKDLPWNAFVGNRVKEIRSLSSVNRWYHVPGSFNCADLASRGCNAKDLYKSRWWEGPQWLSTKSEDWPKSAMTLSENDIAISELHKTVSVYNVETRVSPFSHFSKYTMIIRTVAMILRFGNNARCKLSHQRRHGEISYEEFEEAEKRIIKIIQGEHIELIGDKNLCTFYDDFGILRLKTKLSLCDELENFKYPIVVPAKNIIIQRMVEQRHVQLQHAGAGIMITDIRKRFWIIGIRRAVRSVISRCIICKRHKAKPAQAPTAPLPIDRVQASAPFEVTGIDLAGPLYLRDGQKCWIVLYTCAVYRAVHLELTQSLSAHALMMTLRRFIARRGRVKVIYSDNGTNLVGTKNALAALDWDEIQQYSSVERIKWKLNAPAAPWWGGFWERLIRLVKELLRRVLGKSCVSYEELETILCDCEATINGRPLTYVEDDKAEMLQPLTPSCFLQPLPQSDVPDLDRIDSNSLNNRFKYLSKLRADFRQRFKSEYLTALYQRGKDKHSKLEVGDIVMIETEDKRVK